MKLSNNLLAKEFKELYEKGFSSYKIAKKFGVSDSKVRYWLKKNNTKIKPSHRYVNKITAPIKLSKKLAYILGVVGPGDGFLMYNSNKRKVTYRIGLRTVDLEFANRFKLYLEQLYNLRCYTNVEQTDHKDVYVVVLCSKAACEHLLIFVENVNEFREKSWIIPKVILNAKVDEKKEYIKGFADSQGCVYIKNSVKHIFLSSCNTKGLKQMQKLLSDLKLKSSLQKNRLSITGFSNIKRFEDKINFTINTKRDKLHQLLSTYKYSMKKARSNSEQVSSAIQEMTSLRFKDNLSYKQIGEKVGLHLSTVHRRLNRVGGSKYE